MVVGFESVSSSISFEDIFVFNVPQHFGIITNFSQLTRHFINVCIIKFLYLHGVVIFLLLLDFALLSGNSNVIVVI